MLLDLDVIDLDGAEVGYVVDTWPLDGGGEPELVLVAVGVKFPRPRYLPLRDAEIVGECLHIPYTLLEVEEAPAADDKRWGDPGDVARSYWAAHGLD